MSKMNRMLSTLLMVGLLAVAASAGTWAYFQDSASGNAKIVAGNPDLVTVFGGNVYDVLGDIYLPHLVPGDNGYMNLGEVQNRGTTGGNLFIKVTPPAGIASDLHIYACDASGNALTGVDLLSGTEVQLGSMGAKVGSDNAKFPVKIYFNYHETGNPQTGNGASYNIPVTLSLRTTGTAGQNINVANDYYATH